jgi:hypothetical protein
MGPWTDDQIARARSVPLLKLISHICDHVKEDREYRPLDSSSRSRRFQLNCRNRDFRLILKGEKWVDELVPRGSSQRGGGGAIDLASHLTGSNFVQSVRLCLDAAGTGDC